MNNQAPLEIVSGINASQVNASIIFLHGLGANGYDFEPIVQKLNLPHIRFILPHAPNMPITRHGAHIMPAWYDLYGQTGHSQEDEDGIKNSQHHVNALIQKELDRGVAAERILIAGFSQGGAVALYAALRHKQKLAGVIALSTYLVSKEKLSTEAHIANAQIPIFMAHGVFDDVIPLAMCKNALHILQSQHYCVELHEYPIKHSVCIEEIDDMRAFITRVLP